MKILANRHLYKIEEILPDESELHLFDPSRFPANAADFDAMLINTTTAINSKTLPKAGRLKFIATGSAGDDHVDKDHLDRLRIKFANAAGCNAVSVSEYVITAILIYADKYSFSLSDLKVGVIGCGNTGSAVVSLLEKLSIARSEYDPPREIRDSGFKSAYFEELFGCDVLTFHTPLTFYGDYPTYHMLNDSWFSRKKFGLIINTARGGVIDEKAVIRNLSNGGPGETVIDVWENEPLFDDELAEMALIATPHIAGYSVQSKLRASKIISDALCDHFGLKSKSAPESHAKIISIPENAASLSDVLKAIHPIAQYDQKFRKLTGFDDRGKREEFYELRTGHPLRNEFSALKIDKKWFERFPVFESLGLTSLS